MKGGFIIAKYKYTFGESDNSQYIISENEIVQVPDYGNETIMPRNEMTLRLVQDAIDNNPNDVVTSLTVITTVKLNIGLWRNCAVLIG